MQWPGAYPKSGRRFSPAECLKEPMTGQAAAILSWFDLVYLYSLGVFGILLTIVWLFQRKWQDYVPLQSARIERPMDVQGLYNPATYSHSRRASRLFCLISGLQVALPSAFEQAPLSSRALGLESFKMQVFSFEPSDVSLSQGHSSLQCFMGLIVFKLHVYQLNYIKSQI